MLDRMTSRGPDSAGIALYGEPSPGDGMRYSVRADTSQDWEGLAERLGAKLGVAVAAQRRADAAVLLTPCDWQRFLPCLRQTAPEVMLVGYGTAMEVYKDVGAPAEICDRYDVSKRADTRAWGIPGWPRSRP